MFSIFNDIAMPIRQRYDMKDQKPLSAQFLTRQFGVYEVIFDNGRWLSLPGAETLQALGETLKNIPYFVRFMKDIWILGPSLVTVYVIATLWSSLRPTFDLYCASQLLEAVSST